MYENCAKKFYKHTNTELLSYLIRALFKAGRLSECRQMLLKARHISPEDPIFMYNLALVEQKLSKQVMADNKSNLKTVEKAIHDLQAAFKTFTWLAASSEGERLKGEFKCDLKYEARQCQDLITQSSIFLQRAQKLDEQERELKRKQEMEIQQLKLKQLELEKQKEEELRQQEEVLKEKRAEFVKKTQNIVTQNIITEEKEKKSSKKRSKKEASDIISTGSESEDNGEVSK